MIRTKPLGELDPVWAEVERDHHGALCARDLRDELANHPHSDHRDDVTDAEIGHPDAVHRDRA